MPRRYRKKKRVVRKRRYRKKTGFNKQLLGNTLATTLVYNEQYTLNADVFPALAIQMIRANGLFDPNVTGGGHQPRGFDEIMPLYDHFVVVGSKITIKIPASLDPHMVGIALKDSTTLQTTLVGYQEGRHVRSRMISSNSGGTTIISMGFSAKRFLGRSHPMSDSQLKGSVAADPVEQAYFHIFTGSPQAGGGNPPLIVIDATIQYRVVFIEPHQPTQS